MEQMMKKKDYANKIASDLNIKRTKNDYNPKDGTINKHFLNEISKAIEKIKEKKQTDKK